MYKSGKLIIRIKKYRDDRLLRRVSTLFGKAGDQFGLRVVLNRIWQKAQLKKAGRLHGRASRRLAGSDRDDYLFALATGSFEGPDADFDAYKRKTFDGGFSQHRDRRFRRTSTLTRVEKEQAWSASSNRRLAAEKYLASKVTETTNSPDDAA